MATQLDLPLDAERRKLESYLADLYRPGSAQIVRYRKSTSGHSNETRFFTLILEQDGATTEMHLGARWAPAGSTAQFDSYDIPFQFKAMAALAKAGIPVPQMIALEDDPALFGGPFFLMEQVAGDTTSDYPPGYHGAGLFFDAPAEQRAAMWWDSLKVMADINRTDWTATDFAFLDRPVDGREAVQWRLDKLGRLIGSGAAAPIEPIARAMAWLEAHIPPHPVVALCWGDGRPGNIIFRDYRAVAALDFEMMHLGPPEDDLAWFILVDEVAYRAHQQPRLSGLPGMEETIVRYEQMIGRKTQNLDYHLLHQSTWLAAHMVMSANMIQALGIPGYPADYATNNVAIDRLQQLLAQLPAG